MGLFERPIALVADGTLRTAAARIFPWGLAPLLGGAPAQGVPEKLEQRWPELGAAVLKRLDTGDLDCAVAALERSLLERVATALPEPPGVAAARALAEGDSAVGDVAARHHRMSREFKRFSGPTPQRFAVEMAELRATFAPVDVAFVQDASDPDALSSL